MKRSFFKSIKNNAKHYSNKSDISFWGALLKTSLIPLSIFERYIPKGSIKILDLGCGEGMLSNTLAMNFPNATITGIDLNKEKIDLANRCSHENSKFECGDIFDLSEDSADVVIFNDVLHHHPKEIQEELLAKAHSLLKNGGILFLKEVHRRDLIDRSMTTFFDRKLYPGDTLTFRGNDEWESILYKSNFQFLKRQVVKHPWVASRTVFVVRKIEDFGFFPQTTGSTLDEQKPTIFLTGATGFIGHHLALSLIDEGLNGKDVNLIVLARTPQKLHDRIIKNALIVQGDLNSLRESNFLLLDKIDYVLHLAAEVKFFGNPQSLRDNNQTGTEAIIDCFKKQNIKRFILASTVGAVDREPTDDCSQPLTENVDPNPLSVYGQTKLAGEKYLKDSGIDYTIIRVPWCFGPKMTSDTHVRNLFQRVMKKSAVTRINFPGKVSLIAVEDLVRAFKFVTTENEDTKNEIFFATGFAPISLGEVFKLMRRAIGTRAFTVSMPSPIVAMLQKLRRYLPLQFQNLCSNVLTASSDKISSRGFRPEAELLTSLRKLSHWIHQEDYASNPKFLVTGAASGIGKELAQILYANGFDLVLVDVQKEELEKVSFALEATPIAANLSTPEDIESILTYISDDKNIHGVVNCAGVGIKNSLLETTNEKIKNIIDVNVTAQVLISKKALEIYHRQGFGTLVNISSSSALQPLPYFSVYSASKAFVSSFTDSIWYEERNEANIRVLNIIPSGTDTNFQAASGVKKNLNEKLLNAEYVASRIFEAANRKGGTCYIGTLGKVMSVLTRILPKKLNIILWGQLIKRAR